MAHKSDLIAEEIEAYLKAHEHKSILRFMTCGSVDDGKSTLIGRLLYESKMIFEDQLAAIEADSKKVGTQGGELRDARVASDAFVRDDDLGGRVVGLGVIRHGADHLDLLQIATIDGEDTDL